MADVQGVYTQRAGDMTRRMEDAAVRDARRKEMMARDAERQALYKRQQDTGMAHLSIKQAQAELAKLRREQADTLAEIEEAAERMGDPGYRPGRLAGLRAAAEDFPAVIAGAEARLQAARDALVALADPPEPEPVTSPDVDTKAPAARKEAHK